jgi:hypothetical protein
LNGGSCFVHRNNSYYEVRGAKVKDFLMRRTKLWKTLVSRQTFGPGATGKCSLTMRQGGHRA